MRAVICCLMLALLWSNSLLADVEPQELRAGQRRTDNGLKMPLVWCPPGKFLMGSPDSDNEAGDDEKPQHDVTLTRGFWLGQTEVTQKQWTEVMGTTPWKERKNVKVGPSYAASWVSYDEALEFCRKLTDQERRAGRLEMSEQYALPTEAQWEYACRAGTTTRFNFGDDATKLGGYAWYEKNAYDIGDKYSHEVGQKKANLWGLHDMHGNAWEWCLDSYAVERPGGRDPFVSVGSRRVVRGGGWDGRAAFCRSTNRFWFPPALSSFSQGFRVARVSEQAK